MVMSTGDVLVMIGSMLAAFVLGLVAMLFMAGRTTLNYLRVKMSRGKRILVFGRTPFGWRSFVGKKVQETVEWFYDGTKLITSIGKAVVSKGTTVEVDGVETSVEPETEEFGVVGRYMRQDAIFVDTRTPTIPLVVRSKGIYPEDFDAETFNNLLVRAQTKPSTDGAEELKKLLRVMLVGLVLIGFGVLALYLKVSNFTSSTGVVI